MKNQFLRRIFVRSLILPFFFGTVILFSSCLPIMIVNTLESIGNPDADEFKLDASIKTSKSKNSITISITPKKEKPIAYTLFEVKDGTTTEIERIAPEQAYSIQPNGTLKLNTIPSATFTVKDKTNGTFYIAVEVDNKSYKKDDDISIYTKILFTKLISIH
ncbi:MAG: hypothetical protein K6A43_07620 [Treponema sp.]|nr:hypothetical protein [Treponema sp.]